MIDGIEKEKLREKTLEDEDCLEAGNTKALVNQARIEKVVKES